MLYLVIRISIIECIYIKILSFILPDNVPEPKGNPAHTKIFPANIAVNPPSIVVDFELWAEQLEESLGGNAKVTTDSDADRDGVKDVIEYVTGTDALDPTSMHHLDIRVERHDGEEFTRLAVPLRVVGEDAEVTVEQSLDGQSWEAVGDRLEFIERQPINDWSALVHLRSTAAISQDASRTLLFRLRAVVDLD